MKTLLAIVALVVVAGGAWYVLFGSGSEGAVSLGQPPKPKTALQTAQATGTLLSTRSFEVWFTRGGRLVESLRTHAPTRKVAAAALAALLAGPTRSERASGVSSAIPPGARPLGVSIANGVATVDLSSEFESGAASRSLKLRLAQVVYTLTQFPTVDTVRFEINGTPVDVFSSGGIVLDHPVGRVDYKGLGPKVPALAGTWQPLARAPIAAPIGRTSVWTGRQLLVLGRVDGSPVFAAYEPLTNTWRPLTRPPGPVGSGPIRSVWTGKEMLVWSRTIQAAYNPRTGRWRPLASPPVGPAPAVVVWTGRELIGWTGTGAVAYRPATGSWRTLPPVPLRGQLSSAGVWTGRDLVVLSGARAAAYSPATNHWRRLAPMPEARAGASAVWDGHEVLVFGGRDAPAEGFAYDPGTNRWRRLAPMDAGRAAAAVVWTGKRLLMWGGETGRPGAFVIPPHGFAYDPRSDTWSALPPAPLRGRLDPVGAWTGHELLIWGGDPGFSDGAAFTPSG